jgi:hypothetical protein
MKWEYVNRACNVCGGNRVQQKIVMWRGEYPQPTSQFRCLDCLDEKMDNITITWCGPSEYALATPGSNAAAIDLAYCRTSDDLWRFVRAAVSQSPEIDFTGWRTIEVY